MDIFCLLSSFRATDDSLISTVDLENMENTSNPFTELSFNDRNDYVTSIPRGIETQVKNIKHLTALNLSSYINI
jgi:hypothetical protein